MARPSHNFLRLPGELRNAIYDYLFSSTRIVTGDCCKSPDNWEPIDRSCYSLSILRTCSAIYRETKDLWIDQVTFVFANTEDMLDRLAPLPPSTISQIRHACVGGRTLPLCSSSTHPGHDYKVTWALKLIPDLRLDTLTVLDENEPVDCYATINGLIWYGNGWKELRYITPRSAMLGYGYYPRDKWPVFGEGYLRQSQPGGWNKTIKRRDGDTSGASVTIYQSTKPNVPGATLKENTRRIVEQPPFVPGYPGAFLLEEDRKFLNDGEIGKEILVVVKRGQQAKIGEPRQGPCFWNDIRLWSKGDSWASIKEAHNRCEAKYSPSDSSDDCERTADDTGSPADFDNSDIYMNESSHHHSIE